MLGQSEPLDIGPPPRNALINPAIANGDVSHDVVDVCVRETIVLFVIHASSVLPSALNECFIVETPRQLVLILLALDVLDVKVNVLIFRSRKSVLFLVGIVLKWQLHSLGVPIDWLESEQSQQFPAQLNRQVLGADHIERVDKGSLAITTFVRPSNANVSAVEIRRDERNVLVQSWVEDHGPFVCCEPRHGMSGEKRSALRKKSLCCGFLDRKQEEGIVLRQIEPSLLSAQRRQFLRCVHHSTHISR